MSFPISVLYTALRKIERAHSGGITVGEIGGYLEIDNPEELVAILLDEGFVYLSTPDIGLNSKVIIKNEGVKALLEYGLQIAEDASDEDDEEEEEPARRGFRGIKPLPSWALIPIILLLCVFCFVLGGYLYATSNSIDWLIHLFVPQSIPSV